MNEWINEISQLTSLMHIAVLDWKEQEQQKR